MMDEATERRKEFTCPECAAGGKNTVYFYATALGSHRFRAHGVRGISKSTVAARKKKSKPLGRPRGGGKKMQRLAAAQAQQAAQANTLVGYAIAKLEERAREIAREHNLPEREFTVLVAKRLAEMAVGEEQGQ